MIDSAILALYQASPQLALAIILFFVGYASFRLFKWIVGALKGPKGYRLQR